MTTWFTSDPPYGHRNIIDYCKRPFASVEAMNEALIANYNAVVKAGDTVIIVGVVTLDERKVKDVLAQLNGVKHLIVGNHDACHPANKRYRERNVQRYFDYGFASVELQRVVDYGAAMGTVLITHVPIGSTRYVEYQPTVDGLASDNVRWVIHGHVHEAWRKRGSMVNVGDFAPVSLEQLMSYLAVAPENDPVPALSPLAT
jgi:calcineurin-like phosphoesterase family protein